MRTERSVTKNPAPKQKLFISHLQPYDAVKLDCAMRRNLGALERSGQGGASHGTLDAKRELIELIADAGGDFPNEQGFVAARSGQLRRGAGTGYVGWKDFGTRAAAINYLARFFDIKECGPNDPAVATGTKPKAPKKSVGRPSLATDSNSSAAIGLSNSERGRSKNDLERLGFKNVAQWTILDETRLKVVGDDAGYWGSVMKTSSALYAFCHGDDVIYIGKTARSVEQRFVGYRSPGKKQATNLKCHRAIRRLLEQDQTVRILVFPDISQLQWDDFRISLAAGLEDALVAHFRPTLNASGKGGEFVTTTMEDERQVEKRKA